MSGQIPGHAARAPSPPLEIDHPKKDKHNKPRPASRTICPTHDPERHCFAGAAADGSAPPSAQRAKPMPPASIHEPRLDPKAANINWRHGRGCKRSPSASSRPATSRTSTRCSPDFVKTLTGVDARLEMTPPGQIRQKAVLDLSSKHRYLGESHAADPMYYHALCLQWLDRSASTAILATPS